MVIDSNGRVYLSETLIVDPKFELTALLETPEHAQWAMILPTEVGPRATYNKDVLDPNGSKATVWLMFIQGTLRRIYLSYFLTSEQQSRIRIVRGWESDLERQKLHQQILQEDLGRPPYAYSWGNITIGTNELDLTSTIKVTYRI